VEFIYHTLLLRIIVKGTLITQEIADLFGEYFQGVYVGDISQEAFVVEGDVVPWFR
jgi:hypothetical protein